MNNQISSENYKVLYQLIFDLYHLEENKAKLLFHGWHHIKFVHDKSIEFALELNADLELVASSALVHDLNYIFSDRLEPEAAKVQIKQYLLKAKFTDEQVETILGIVNMEDLPSRMDVELTKETKALSDADTLFKILPTTPILFSSRFLIQNKYSIEKLANKIINDQEPLIQKDQFFFTKKAKDNYSAWAEISLQLWKNVKTSLEDPAINEMLKNAEDLGVL